MVSSRTCRTDPSIVVQIQQKPKSPSPPRFSLLPNLANPLEIATCGREAVQLIYVASEALTRKRELAGRSSPRCIPRTRFVHEFVIAIISNNLSLPLTGCFFFFFHLPRICILNRCGLFHDGALQSQIRDPYVWFYILFKGLTEKYLIFIWFIWDYSYIAINMWYSTIALDSEKIIEKN